MEYTVQPLQRQVLYKLFPIGMSSLRFMTAGRADLHLKYGFQPYMNLIIKVFDSGHNYIF